MEIPKEQKPVSETLIIEKLFSKNATDAEDALELLKNDKNIDIEKNKAAILTSLTNLTNSFFKNESINENSFEFAQFNEVLNALQQAKLFEKLKIQTEIKNIFSQHEAEIKKHIQESLSQDKPFWRTFQLIYLMDKTGVDIKVFQEIIKKEVNQMLQGSIKNIIKALDIEQQLGFQYQDILLKNPFSEDLTTIIYNNLDKIKNQAPTLKKYFINEKVVENTDLDIIIDYFNNMGINSNELLEELKK